MATDGSVTEYERGYFQGRKEHIAEYHFRIAELEADYDKLGRVAGARIAELEIQVAAAEGKAWKWADDFAKENRRAETLAALLREARQHTLHNRWTGPDERGRRVEFLKRIDAALS